MQRDIFGRDLEQPGLQRQYAMKQGRQRHTDCGCGLCWEGTRCSLCGHPLCWSDGPEFDGTFRCFTCPATVKRSALETVRMTAGNEKRYPAVIDHGIRKEWVGIGWIDTGKASATDYDTMPVVSEEE